MSNRPQTVCFVRLTLRHIPRVLISRLRGRSVYALDADLPSFLGRSAAIRHVDAALVETAPIPNGSYDEPMRKFADLVEDWSRARHWRKLLEDFKPGDFEAELLRTALIRKGSEHAGVAFRILLLTEALQSNFTTVVCENSWQADVVRAGLPVRTPARVLAPLVPNKSLGRLQHLVKNYFRSSFATPGAVASGPNCSPDGSTGSGLLFLNQGLTYGRLYSYDFLMEPFPLDPQTNLRDVALLSRSGGKLINGEDSAEWPSLALNKRSHLKILASTAFACLRSPGIPFHVIREGFVIHGRSQSVRRHISKNFPKARVAVYAFDSRIPVEFTIALQLLGIRSVALHERPVTAVTSSIPLAVHTLLTASEQFSKLVMGNPVHAIRTCIPVGMWRTDLFFEERTSLPARPSRPVILILPYHAQRQGAPHSTSEESVEFFLSDIAQLASELPEADFVIRSKQTEWLSSCRFNGLRSALAELPNVNVDDEEKVIQGAYRWLASASLVIGKHTSLIDEALALDIPTLVHDYGENNLIYARDVVNYIPEAAWVGSHDELLVRSRSALRDKTHFSVVMKAQTTSVFGDWADGHVRRRYSDFVKNLAAHEW